jgi:signal transduction histidine kinase
LNLISNAIRYRSSERKPYVRASAKISYDEVELLIEDNGLGINLDRFGNQVFEMYKTFHQHPESRGIGLFITKSQIESMGGTIAVQSSPNVGSTFSVKWPRN